ncbi:hypothetical protein IIY59_00870 [Candidatus Saccharibacteria bacterium]|nr:hypothetical protein [Candidatus Saccharibacteria bacterium]
MSKIVFPEGNNDFIQKATENAENFEPVLLKEKDALVQACKIVADNKADAVVAGIDYSSRDVILAARDYIGLPEGKKLFSSLFVCDFPDGNRKIIADGATCKNPTAEQLAEIIRLVYQASLRLLEETPKIAMLSFSTFGSGGHDPSIDKIREAIELTRNTIPGILIDGEMQLDAAVNPRIGEKKSSHSSEVAGHANVLITPDINSGNILYKSVEQFAKAHVAGPILLGFKKPVSDLSRGSTVEDVKLTIDSVLKLI